MLNHFYPNHRNDVLAKVLGRSMSSINNAAHKWEFKKSDEFVKELTRRSWQKGNHENSIKHQFRKNHEPWNKGTKGLQIGGVQTQFKPGNVPHGTKYDGAISVRTDTSGHTYKYIRIKKSVWKLYHRHVWEQHHGPIPEKHVVVFKDGNWQNCDISNLECISTRENMLRNSVQRYPEEIKEVIRARAVLTRTINSIIHPKSQENGKEQND